MLLCVYGAHRVLSRALAQIIKLVRASLHVWMNPATACAYAMDLSSQVRGRAPSQTQTIFVQKVYSISYEKINDMPPSILTPTQDHADYSTFGRWRGKSRFCRVTLVPNWHTKLWCNMNISHILTAHTGQLVGSIDSTLKLHAMGIANPFGFHIAIWITEVYIRGDRSSYAKSRTNEEWPYKAKQKLEQKVKHQSRDKKHQHSSTPGAGE